MERMFYLSPKGQIVRSMRGSTDRQAVTSRANKHGTIELNSCPAWQSISV